MEKELLNRRKQLILELVNESGYLPMKIKELAILLQIPKEARNDLREVLDALIKEGKLSVSKRGKYAKAETFALTGTFLAHPKGFGFVAVEDQESDVYIPPDFIHGAFHGDRVQVVVSPDRADKKRLEGKITNIIERANTEVIGTFQKNKHFGFVIPDNEKIVKDIFIPEGMEKGAVTGHKVVAEIRNFGDDRHKPEGFVKEIIGHINDPGTDILSIIKAYGLPETFPETVMTQLNTIPDAVLEKDREGRLDLRDWPTVTIDGEDAKDLDDAITLVKEKEIYTLGVHIADVTNYVKEGSPLDQEALKRGTSVYLVDRVIPMLPHKLSNGICSLNAGTDRLALSCIMEIDHRGTVIGHRIEETLIHVDKRMTYTAVNGILEHQDSDLLAEYQEWISMFELMLELSKLLRSNRRRRGAIDFDFPESKIILDKKGRPVEIKPYERNAATKLIEDFMLIANETIAEDYFWQEIPFLYRGHETPDPEKLQKLGSFINNFGYAIHVGADGIHPKELQKLLDRIEDSPEEALISRLTLRSMKRAKYTTIGTGHFGLATQYYTHFTSPIRRYPDLQIHRIIKENLHGGLNEKRLEHYEDLLPGVAAESSALERRAEEAERETDKLKKVEYMSKRIGQVFEGVISGVTGWGFYVELPNTIEGLVHINALTDDYYIYDEAHWELIGETTRKSYKLGQKIVVKVADVNYMARTIDFITLNSWESEGIQTEGV